MMTNRSVRRVEVVAFINNFLINHSSSLKNRSRMKKDLLKAKEYFELSDETIQSMQDEFVKRMEIGK